MHRRLTRIIDLHAHTNASDGEHSPEELIEIARARGVTVLGIADHDTVAGLDRARAAARTAGDLEIIPGVELSTDIPGFEVHVLGYLMDWQDRYFMEMLAQFQEGRIGRARKIADKLQALGAPVSFARIQAIAGDGAIGRPHVAQALVEAGHVANVKEAFDKYLANDKPAYVEHYSLPPVQAVQLIARAGGVPVLAHPSQVTQLVPELVKGGLLGLECYYAEYDERTQHSLADLAKQYGLIATGGSDFHGLHRMGHLSALGQVHVPPEVVDQLKQAKERGRHSDDGRRTTDEKREPN